MNNFLRLTLTAVAVSVSAPLPGFAQVDEIIKPGPEINEISQATTLLVAAVSENGILGNGSGSLIAKDGDTCVGVTNAHVVDVGQNQNVGFVVRTADQAVHPVSDVYIFNQEDLALVAFECTQDYEPIPLATYQLSPGQEVYLSGWPADSSPDGDTYDFVRQFTSGSISTVLDQPFWGYQIGYTNVTNRGMSGGQVLDTAGRLVAVHGLGAREDAGQIAARLGVDESTAAEFADKTGFNYGIPVTTLLARASQAGFNYPFEVVYTTPQPPANGVVAQGDYVYEPDESDQVNFDNVLDNAGRLLDTIDAGADLICRFVGC
ncbi:MAG: serine protease [Cyanobacteria bacterium P01_D01_bin.115]